MKEGMKQLLIISCFAIFSVSVANGQGSAADSTKLSLHRALKEALENNELIKTAQAKLSGVIAGYDESQGALLPRLNANFSYSYLDFVPGFKKTYIGTIGHDFYPNFSIQQPLYTGGKLKLAQKAAEANVKSQEQALQNEQLNIKLAVTLTYYQLQSLQNQIQILQENHRQLQTHQRYARLLVEAGRMSNLELDRIAVEIANIDGGLLKLQINYQALSHNLGVLLGRAEQQTFIAEDSLQVEPLEQMLDYILQTALQNNPAWKQFDWELRKAEAKIKIQKAARLPQVSTVAWYGYEFGTEFFYF